MISPEYTQKPDMGNMLDEELDYIQREPDTEIPWEPPPGSLAGIGQISKPAKEMAEDIVKGITHFGPDIEVTPNKVKQVQSAYESPKGSPPEKLTRERNINIHRHHKGALKAEHPDINDVKTADDIANYLDATADSFGMNAPDEVYTHERTRAESSSLPNIDKLLKPVYEGRQTGLLNARQMHAARNLLSTMGENIVKMANEIAEGNAKPQMLSEYQLATKNFATLQAYVQDNVRELARALGQQRMIAEGLDANSAAFIRDAMIMDGGEGAIVRHAKLLSKKVEQSGVEGLVHTLNLRDHKRALVEYWKANLLWSPSTHAANTMGGVLTNMWETFAVRPTAAGVGTYRRIYRAAKGQPPPKDLVTWREAYVKAASSGKGILNGLRGVKQMLLNKSEIQGPEALRLLHSNAKVENEGAMEPILRMWGEKAGGATGEKIGAGTAKVLSLPYRLLEAEDYVFKAYGYTTELEALSIRQAVKEGLPLESDQFYRRVNELKANPPVDMQEKAFQHAQRVTFQDKELGGWIGQFAKSMSNFAGEFPEFGFIMPFITTPSNIMRYTLDNTALAAVNKDLRKRIIAGGADGDIAAAQVLLGLGVTFSAVAAHQAGWITGKGSENPVINKQLDQTGWKPNSVLLGGKWYTINRAEPLGAAIGMIADGMDIARYAGDETAFQDAFLETGFRLAGHMLDATYMRGLSEFLDAVDQGGYKAARFLASWGAAFIPAGSGTRWMAQAIDPERKRLENKFHKEGLLGKTAIMLGQNIQAMTPFWRSRLRPARWWDGDIAMPGDGDWAFMNALSPVRIGNARKRYDRANDELIKNNVAVQEPSPIMSAGMGENAVTFSLLDLDEGRGIIYDLYIMRVGQERKKRINELIKSDIYKESPSGKNSMRTMILRSELNKAMTTARHNFFYEDIPWLMKKVPEMQEGLGAMIGDYDAFLQKLEEESLTEKQMEMLKLKRGHETVAPPPHHEAARKEADIKEQRSLSISF